MKTVNEIIAAAEAKVSAPGSKTEPLAAKEARWHEELIAKAWENLPLQSIASATVGNDDGVRFSSFAVAREVQRTLPALPHGYEWVVTYHEAYNGTEWHEVELVDALARHQSACGDGYEKGSYWRLGSLKA